MFFDLKTLTKGGKFCLIWKAANCGVNKLKDKEVLSIDICVISDEVVKLVCSRSTKPEERMSLFLSSKLTSGILRVYGRQVQLLFNDLYKYYVDSQAIMSPKGGMDDGDSETPLAVIKRVKKIRTKKPAAENNKENQPEDALASLERSLAQFDKHVERLSASMEVHRRSDEITLREVSMPLREIPANLNVECGELEKYITELVTLPEVSLIEKSTSSKKRRATEEIEDVIKEVSQLNIQISAPVGAETAKELQDLSRIESIRVEQQHAQEKRQEEVQEVSQELQGQRQEPNQEQRVEPQVVIRVQGDRHRNKRDNHLIVTKHRKNVAIDMNLEDRMLLFQHESDNSEQEPEEELIPCNVIHDIFGVLEQFMVNDHMRGLNLQEGTLQLSSKSLSKISGIHDFASSTPIRKPLTPPTRQSMLPGVSQLLPSIHEEIQQHTGELEIPKIRDMHSDVVKPQDPTDISLITEQVSCQLGNTVSKSHDAHLIMEALTNLKAFGQERIVLEDIAERPFTRRSISSAFNNLLILAKQRYVTLHSCEDSIELSHIEIGPKKYQFHD